LSLSPGKNKIHLGSLEGSSVSSPGNVGFGGLDPHIAGYRLNPMKVAKTAQKNKIIRRRYL
jgi:hypothetical protein